MELDDDESKLELTMKNKSTRNFSLALLNLDEDDIPQTDDLDFTVTADLSTSELANAIGDAAVVGDSVTVMADEDGVVLQAEGDSSDVATAIDADSEGMLDLQADGEVGSMFSLDYLNKIIKAKKLSDSVTVNMGDDFPMRM
ncbi:MAG: hypothetical protein ABEK12_01920, partial [Candidatus Nanohaloarchaea archaeon]